MPKAEMKGVADDPPPSSTFVPGRIFRRTSPTLDFKGASAPDAEEGQKARELPMHRVAEMGRVANDPAAASRVKTVVTTEVTSDAGSVSPIILTHGAHPSTSGSTIPDADFAGGVALPRARRIRRIGGALTLMALVGAALVLAFARDPRGAVTRPASPAPATVWFASVSVVDSNVVAGSVAPTRDVPTLGATPLASPPSAKTSPARVAAPRQAPRRPSPQRRVRRP